MRNSILLPLLTLLLFIVCGCTNSSRFVLDGIITNAQNGEMICLSYPVKCEDIWYEQRDTTYIDSGRFRFEGVVDGVVPAGLSFPNMDFANIFIEPSEMTFSAERSAMCDYSLEGLSIDAELKAYKEAFAEYDRAIYQATYKATRKNEEWIAASEANAENVDDLFSEFYSMVLEHHAIADKWPAMAVDFVNSNPQSTLVPDIIDRLIQCEYDNSVVESLINSLSAQQRQSILGELMMIRYGISELNGGEVGSRALDFTLMTASGDKTTLSQYITDRYLLLDFWASWCHPCVEEIPKVRQVYAEYGDRLQIVSISVDENQDKWREAVALHNIIEWPQLIIEVPEDADDYYFREQANPSYAYNIQQIPCFILIDSDGMIVGRWSHLTRETVAEIASIIAE